MAFRKLAYADAGAQLDPLIVDDDPTTAQYQSPRLQKGLATEVRILDIPTQRRPTK